MTPSPTPIPVQGKAQVFADNECMQYADGTQNNVYVRVNVDVPVGQSLVWGNGSDPMHYLRIDAAGVSGSTEASVIAYIDWYLDSPLIQGEIPAGTIFTCYNADIWDTPQEMQVVFD